MYNQNINSLISKSVLILFGITGVGTLQLGCAPADNTLELQQNEATGAFAIPMVVQSAAIDPQCLSAWVRFDNGVREAMTISGGRAELVKQNVSIGQHSIDLEFECNDPDYSRVSLATATRQIDVQEGANEVAFTENDYFPLPDFDNDYYTNINELEQRTSPFSSTPSKPMGSIAGTWQVTETITSASGVCSGDVNSVATYNMNIQETGNSIFINVDSMSGTLSAALIGQRLVWAGSLSDATSTLTVNETDIQVSGSCNTLSGTFGWSWSDVSNSCTGQSNIEAVRTVANGCGTNAYAESEPNDLLSSANVINEVPISITGSTQGDLQNSDFSSDIDHYLIDFTSPSKIIVRLEGVDTNADIDLYVYTEDFVEIVSSGNVGPNEQLELTINQLPLYIGVLPWSVPNTATYTLSVSGL